MSSEPKGYAADRQAAEPGIDATKDRQTGTREEHKTWTAKWMDGGGGKGAELGDLLPARLPSACIMCPRSHASIHSLAWWRREENRHKSPKPNIREREGDRIRVGGADAAARYDDRRRSNEEAEWGRDGKSNA